MKTKKFFITRPVEPSTAEIPAPFLTKSINFRHIMQDQFRTIVTPPRAPFTISHRDRLMSIGSCFSEHIGRYFRRYKFHTDINPFGQQYNPASIANALDRLVSAKSYNSTDLIHHGDQYHSFDHHSDFSTSSEVGTLEAINIRLTASAESLRSASVLFLTFGTAHVFKLKDSDKAVSNCHKIPSTQFDFALLSPAEIVDLLSQSLEALWKINPDIRIVLTVSPVRYFAFGHFENSVSKGHLFAAIHSLIAKYPQLYYFPSYEIVMDDLRDYRFFADDMLHPTPQAIQYVWDKLEKALLPTETQKLLRELDDIESAINHRPRNPNSEAHQKFKANYLGKVKAMEAKFNFDFEAEKSKLM